MTLGTGAAMDEREATLRFDDRQVISAIIARMKDLGASLDMLDVELSRRGPVDLDLLQDCLDESAERALHAQPRAA